MPLTSTLVRLEPRLAHWREWEMNPVLLKELRQAVRSQVLIGTLMTALSLMFLISAAYLTRQELLADRQPQLGLSLFRTFLLVLTPVSLLFIPLYIGVRLALERRDADVELMFITALPAERIVRGKLLCGGYLLAMFFSICSPFMIFTNLLRGVDLPTISLILICLYVSACIGIQLAICYACLPFRTVLKALSGLALVFLLVVICGGMLIFFSSLLRSGASAALGSIKSWLGLGMTLLLILGGIGLLHVMSVSLITADQRPRGYFNEVIKT